MGPQFIRFEGYGRVGAHHKNSRRRKRSMHGIAAEQVREPHACPHLADPKPHIQRFGCDPRDAVAFADELGLQAVDVRGRRLRCDAPIILAGVISWPEPLAPCLDDAEAMSRWAAFRDDSIAWLRQYWGDHLMSVVEHIDEAQPHIQFIAVSHLDADRRLHLTRIHPGLRAGQAAAERGGSKREQKKAHQAAMKQFQNNFYYDVASRHGLKRLGKKRQRFERNEWMARKADAEALAEAGRRQRAEAIKLVEQAEFCANETIALVQQDARVQIDAAKAETESRVAVVKEKATRYANNVATEFAALQHKLQERDATISAQAEEIEQLREALRRHEATPGLP
ncbi:hypothetical protein ABIC08_002755 [Bradyrhizobium sp. RT9b]|uniref:hypothetical protein n=1 Tax=unclassified Bradyrhizobium TaxID=2631580 RepID=UPI003397B4F1